MPNILTFDLGTTYFKAAVFDPAGAMLALARRDTPIERPQPGRAEIPADVFKDVIGQLLGDLREQAPVAYRAIHHISFATQTNSFLLLDARNEPVTPIIVWTDQRVADVQFPELPEINAYAETGVPAMNAQFMAAKLLWLQQHEPDLWRRARRLCLLSDYLTLWFTGQHVTEVGTAGLTALVNVHDLVWRLRAIEALGLGQLQLPRIVRAGTNLGAIRPGIAEAFGLDAGCEFVVGCLDQYAGAVAADLLKTGGVCETTGTVLATVRIADRFDPALQARGVFQGPTVRPGRYYQMVFGNIAANLLAAYRRDQPDQPSYEQLDAEAAQVRDDPDTLASVAFDPERQQVRFTHRNPSHTRGHDVLAIYHTVAEALRRQVVVLCPDSPPQIIVSLGGAARSRLWLEIKADLLKTSINILPISEPTCLGAARITSHIQD